MKRSPLRRHTPLRHTTEPGATRPLRSGRPPRRRTGLRRFRPLVAGASFLASGAQSQKVAGMACLVCGRRGRIDPAHLVSRAVGGCDEPECVVPLCREHHRDYDEGRLDLVPHLEPAWRVEAAHAVLHLGLAGALRRLTGRRDADPGALDSADALR